jgi:RNA polymerase sigma factor (sigma-70 family)
MEESRKILIASDAELEREIADMFRGYSSKQIGMQMQRMVAEATSQFKDCFSSSEFKEKFGEYLPIATLILCRDMSWHIGYGLSQNLQNDPQRMRRLLEAISRHPEIAAVMEQYRFRHEWGGDIDRAIELGWQGVARKYFRISPKVKDIERDEDQEKLIGMAQGLENYTNKNPAIDALTDGFLGKLGAYLRKAAQNREADYLRKQMTDGNVVLTTAIHASDLCEIHGWEDEEGEELSIDEALSREKQKRSPAGDTVAEEVEAKETLRSWYGSLTVHEKRAISLKQTVDSEKEIAQKMGISQQRVSQLIDQALRKWQKISC